MIQLTKDLVMVADERCYIVGKPKKDRGRGLEIRDPTYHPSAFEAALSALDRAMRQYVKDGSITTLRQFVDEQERLKEELQEMLAPLKCGGEGVKMGGERRDITAEGNCIPQPLGHLKQED